MLKDKICDFTVNLPAEEDIKEETLNFPLDIARLDGVRKVTLYPNIDYQYPIPAGSLVVTGNKYIPSILSPISDGYAISIFRFSRATDLYRYQERLFPLLKRIIPRGKDINENPPKMTLWSDGMWNREPLKDLKTKVMADFGTLSRGPNYFAALLKGKLEKSDSSFGRLREGDNFLVFITRTSIPISDIIVRYFSEYCEDDVPKGLEYLNIDSEKGVFLYDVISLLRSVLNEGHRVLHDTFSEASSLMYSYFYTFPMTNVSYRKLQMYHRFGVYKISSRTFTILYGGPRHKSYIIRLKNSSDYAPINSGRIMHPNQVSSLKNIPDFMDASPRSIYGYRNPEKILGAIEDLHIICELEPLIFIGN